MTDKDDNLDSLTLKSAEYWQMRHALVTASRNNAVTREMALRDALQGLVQHPAFDRAYISKELASKLDAALAAMAAKP